MNEPNFKYRVIKSVNTEFGVCQYYESDVGRFAMYSYADDRHTVYIANVEIYTKYRGCGFGNEMISFALSTAKKLDYRLIRLMVKSESWMHCWYKRFGFHDIKHDLNDLTYVWMQKEVAK